jgi:hypothetical protein
MEISQQIVTLTNENYRVWRKSIIEIFEINGWEDTLVPIKKLAVNEKEIATALNAEARRTLLGRLGSDIRPKVTSFKTAYEIWESLKNLFMKPSLRTLVRLTCEFEPLRQKINTTESLSERDTITEELDFIKELYKSINFTIDFADFQIVAMEINKLKAKCPSAYEKIMEMNPKDISIPQMRNIVYDWITDQEADRKLKHELNKKTKRLKPTMKNLKAKAQKIQI